MVRNSVKACALKYLSTQNSQLEKTKDIVFDKLETNEYLLDNRSTSLSKIIFCIRTETFDIKKWQPLKYNDSLCVACEVKEETIEHMKVNHQRTIGLP